MIVIADSSPVHYLILLEQVDLLRRLYGEVVLPDVVAKELGDSSAPCAVRDWIARPPAWATIVPVDPGQIQAITDALDEGERSAIALALALRADLLVIDEVAGRAEAKRRNLRVTGTLGVLRAAAEHDLIDVPDVLRRLRTTTFYSSEELLNRMFARWL